MKLVIITNYWIHSDGGGIREYTKNLVNALKKRVEIRVIFREGKDPNNFKGTHNKLRFLTYAYKILKKEKPEAILSQGGWFTEIPAVLYKMKNPSTKILILFHTQYDRKFPFYKRLMYNFIINRFDKVGFVSKALEKNVREVAGLKIKRETFVLYAGVKRRKVTQEEITRFKETFKIPENSIVLLGLGLTALPYKAEGAKLLIQATKILRDRGYNVVLILTRKGKYVSALKNFAKELGVERYVIFTGDIENPFVPLEICDIYTHISLGEGLPISLLEAMVVGKPIVATPVGGIPEAIENGKNGLLVEPDAVKIAEAIEKLIKNPELREKLAKEALKTANEKFKWEATAEFFLKQINL